MDFYGRPTPQFNMGYNAPYNGGYQQPQQQQVPQMRTNKIFVTSLEDALNRYAEPNTIMVYRHQDEKYEYEIVTDAQGKKSYKTLQLADYSTIQAQKTAQADNVPIERFEGIEARLKALEAEVLKKYKEDKRIEKKGGLE